MSLHRLSILAAAGLAVCALAGPALAQQDLRNPDTRDAAKASSQDLRGADTRELPKNGSYSLEPTVVRVPQPVRSADNGLDWGDAGIGAGGMLGLILLAAGAAVAVTHRKSASGAAVTTG
jgi:hypothetical protein